MTVTSGPSADLTVIARPPKLIDSAHTPGPTSTMSPANDTSIADWIVGYESGTRRMSARANAAQQKASTITP